MGFANNAMLLVLFVVVLLQVIACFVLMDIKMNQMYVLKYLLQELHQVNLFVQCTLAILKILEFVFVKVVEF